MNLFRKMIGGKGPERPEEPSFEDDIRELAEREMAADRSDDRSGLVAIYPELGASPRRRRGFADLDIDDYVPELDDYEPGAQGEFLPADEDPEPRPPAPDPLAARMAYPDHQSLARTPAPAQHAPQWPEAPAHPQDAAPLAARPDAHAIPRAAEPAPAPSPEGDAAGGIVHIPGPAIGRAGGRRAAGRVKTRLLGFDSSVGLGTDPFESGQQAAAAAVARFPVGWIVVIAGPGRGASFTLFNGVSAIGRGDDQPVKLDFGDTSISRSNHAVVAYDNEQRKFFLGHGGKANIVRLNGKPVLSTEELNHNDRIRIGETTLRFLALCGEDFDWADEEGPKTGNADRE